MSRLTFMSMVLSFLLFVWLAPLYSEMLNGSDTLHTLWKLIPLEAAVVWGLYAAFSVLSAVRNVKDYPEAQADLFEDIKAAKKALSKAGFDWS